MFESETTEFTFSEKYKFKCRKCGACCHVRTLSFNGAEFQRLKATVNQSLYEEAKGSYLTPTMSFHDVSFKVRDCPFLEDNSAAKNC